MPTWTVRRMLGWITEDLAGRGVQTPRLDGELLVTRAIGCDRVRLYMDLERPLGPDELELIRGYVARRRMREPIAYILGEREFYGRKFEVTAAVLIPRPDTETLIERALALLPKDRTARALDLCTGSGAIGITLAAERPGVEVDVTDNSEAALAIAFRNAKRHGVVERTGFYQGDLWDALGTLWSEPGIDEQIREKVRPYQSNPGPYDLIACNPPYIPRDQWRELAPEITRYEPANALLGGEDGLAYYRRICEQIAKWVIPGGTLLLEVGDGQADAVSEIVRTTGLLCAIQTHRDLRAIQRVVEVRIK